MSDDYIGNVVILNSADASALFGKSVWLPAKTPFPGAKDAK